MNNAANNAGGGHLEAGDLLRLIDGELPEHAIPAVRAHIEACWSCRAQFQEIEMTIGEYVRYQKTTDPLLPPPPAAWPELRFRSAAARQVEPPGLLTIPSRRWFYWRWALVAAAVLIAFPVVQRFRRVPSVDTAHLLQRAGEVEPEARTIRIRAGRRTLLRPALLQSAAQGDDAHLSQDFARAHFNWDQPLSARSFAAWRDQLPEKEDEVRREKTQLYGDAYVIRTSTHSSELHRATMTLRARDLRPVREMLEFTGETVEVEAVAQGEEQAASAPDQAALSQAAPNTAHPAPRRTTDSSPGSALHRMLLVFSTLHSLRADLGEPLEMRQTSSGVEVIAIGMPAARQQQLRAALAAIPSVTLRFDAGAPPPRPTREETQDRPAESAPAASRLEALLGSAQAAEDFTDRALDASDSVLARVHALRALANAFPPAQESAMTAEDRLSLAKLRADHAMAMSQRIAVLRNALRPVLERIATEGTAAATRGSWQEDVQVLFQAAQRMDQVLNRELAGDTSSRSDFGRIATALGDLERTAAAVMARPPDTHP